MSARDKFTTFFTYHTSETTVTSALHFLCLLIFSLFMVLMDKKILKDDDVEFMMKTVRYAKCLLD